MTKRSFYGFVQKRMAGYQARDPHAETSALIPDSAELASIFEMPIADFVLM